jgi:hypothetical protein
MNIFFYIPLLFILILIFYFSLNHQKILKSKPIISYDNTNLNKYINQNNIEKITKDQKVSSEFDDQNKIYEPSIFTKLKPNYNTDIKDYLNLNNYDNTYQISQDKIMSNVECYLIDKKFSDDNEYSKPAFGYSYTKLKDELCDPELYRLDSNKSLIFTKYPQSYYPFEKPMDIQKLGSCRNGYNECIEFVDKEFCNKYNMLWSNQTCNDPIYN